MKTLSTVNTLHAQLDGFWKEKQSIGFVPTMGALHRGHLELVKAAREENSIVVVSIFVNPTQFNNPHDLQTYPRTLEQDLALCEELGVDIVFAPTVEEMYPNPDMRVFDFGNLDKVMEGKHRPGHFNGVAQVVSKLFEMVQPTKAYFGQKDFQQLAVIRELVRMEGYPINIVACPTVREEDGLAMSSRNTLLSAVQRESAPLIYKTLLKAKSMVKESEVQQLVDWVVNEINSDRELEVEYFEVSNAQTLEPVLKWTDAPEIVACIAVKVGDVRLIDNIIFTPIV